LWAFAFGWRARLGGIVAKFATITSLAGHNPPHLSKTDSGCRQIAHILHEAEQKVGGATTCSDVYDFVE
jgi:hypothetical protein